MAGQLPLRIINGELYFTYGKGTWGGGAYYLGGAGCTWGNTVDLLISTSNFPLALSEDI